MVAAGIGGHRSNATLFVRGRETVAAEARPGEARELGMNDDFGKDMGARIRDEIRKLEGI